MDDEIRRRRLLTRLATPADLPRPSMSPVDVGRRFMAHFRAQQEA